MKLNNTQIEYAVKRVREAVHAKMLAEVGECPQEPEKLSDEEKYDMINSRVAKLRTARDRVSSYTRLLDAYSYPPRKEDVEYEKAKKSYEAKYTKHAAKWKQVEQQAIDKIYLCGDAEGALTIINSI